MYVWYVCVGGDVMCRCATSNINILVTYFRLSYWDQTLYASVSVTPIATAHHALLTIYPQHHLCLAVLP